MSTTGSSRTGKTQVPRQARLVETALRNQFGPHIDISDITNPSPVERDRAFASRALAALIVRDKAGCTPAEAAAMVVDGRNDYGIDAVAIGDGTPHLWLVQAKWNHRGEAGIGVADVLKIIDGLRKLDHQEYSKLNPKLQALEGRVRAVLDQPHARITIVLALYGSQQVSDDVVNRLDDVCGEFNTLGTALTWEVRLAPQIWQQIQSEISEPTVDLTVGMTDWYRYPGPHDAYSGCVPVGDVAAWAQEHGDQLLSRNIRRSLGLTQVNQSLVETLTTDPQMFFYFNNGITVLCDELKAVPFSRSAPHGAVSLQLRGASVVNGAQTVSAVAEAMITNPEVAANAMVNVRVIVTGAEDVALPNAITKANNTQNHVERRDYVALDPVQAGIRDDFRLTLQKTYVIKRGELDPAPDAGCSVVQAAIALACAHHNTELTVRAKRDPDLLWEEGPRGAYTLLFSPPPTALEIWRSALLLRAVQEALHEKRAEREGRAASIAEHGDLLIAHLVFQHIGRDDVDDIDADWDNVLAQMPALTAEVTARLIKNIDDTYGTTSFIGSTLGSPDRSRKLALQTLADMGKGAPVPVIPEGYQAKLPRQRTRRRNTVSIVVDSGRIKDGASLTYQPSSENERAAVATWLAENDRRSRATWVNHRSRPLLWAYDGKQYSPTGLVHHIWSEAKWEQAPVAVQGPVRWQVGDMGSLVSVAESVLRSEELPVDGDL